VILAVGIILKMLHILASLRHIYVSLYICDVALSIPSAVPVSDDDDTTYESILHI
jgi:hypothetical protein